MMPLAFLPSSLPEATAARSMSPVESWTMPTLVLQPLGLGALAGARRPQKDDVHRPPQRPLPRSRAFLMRPSYWWASRCAWIWVTVSSVTDTTISRLVPPK